MFIEFKAQPRLQEVIKNINILLKISFDLIYLSLVERNY